MPIDIEKEFIKGFKKGNINPNQKTNLRKLIIDAFKGLALFKRHLLTDSPIWSAISLYMNLEKYHFFNLSPETSKEIPDKSLSEHYNIYYRIQNSSYNIYSIKFDSVKFGNPPQTTIIDGFKSKKAAEKYISNKIYWPELLKNDYFSDINNKPDIEFKQNCNKHTQETLGENNIKVFVDYSKNLAEKINIKPENNYSFLDLNKKKIKIHVHEPEDNRYELENCAYKVKINYTYTVDKISSRVNYTLTIKLINLIEENQKEQILDSIEYQSHR